MVIMYSRLLVLAALTALLISVAPRMLVQVTRDEVAHQVGQLAPTTRDLTGTVSAVVPDGGIPGLESSLSSASRSPWRGIFWHGVQSTAQDKRQTRRDEANQVPLCSSVRFGFDHVYQGGPLAEAIKPQKCAAR